MTTQPQSEIIECKLNATFKEALKQSKGKFKRVYKPERFGVYFQLTDSVLIDLPRHSTLRCCGLSELSFLVLNNTAKAVNALPLDLFTQLIATWIKKGLHKKDKRVVVVGIPRKVGQQSEYNLAFYNRLFDVLVGFGFRQVGKQYKNKGSNNIIVTLIGQIP